MRMQICEIFMCTLEEREGESEKRGKGRRRQYEWQNKRLPLTRILLLCITVYRKNGASTAHMAFLLRDHYQSSGNMNVSSYRKHNQNNWSIY